MQTAKVLNLSWLYCWRLQTHRNQRELVIHVYMSFEPDFSLHVVSHNISYVYDLYIIPANSLTASWVWVFRPGNPLDDLHHPSIIILVPKF